LNGKGDLPITVYRIGWANHVKGGASQEGIWGSTIGVLFIRLRNTQSLRGKQARGIETGRSGQGEGKRSWQGVEDEEEKGRTSHGFVYSTRYSLEGRSRGIRRRNLPNFVIGKLKCRSRGGSG